MVINKAPHWNAVFNYDTLATASKIAAFVGLQCEQSACFACVMYFGMFAVAFYLSPANAAEVLQICDVCSS